MRVRQGPLHRLLILHEGNKLRPYRCSAGKLTIGIGRNLDDKGISKAESLMLCENDIAEVREGLARSLPWYLGLDEVRRAVLEDMAFNMGVHGLLKFQDTLKHIQWGQWNAATKEMFDSLWAYQVGDGPGNKMDRADRLAAMMITGVWPDEVKEER